MNAVYPNGDNMRDIPDYTEFVPGVGLALLRAERRQGDAGRRATTQLKAIANYLKTNIADAPATPPA